MSLRPRSKHTMTPSTPYLLLVLLLLSCQLCLGKRKKGEFKLSGVNTEALISKFTFSGQGDGIVNLSLYPLGSYPSDKLRIYLYTDKDWQLVKKATTCTEKIGYAKIDRRGDIFGSETNFNFRLDNWRATSPVIWYVTIADCSLEEHYQDDKVPLIKYDISLLNELYKGVTTHMPADEEGMFSLHRYNIIISLLLALAIIIKSVKNLSSQSEIHIGLVFVLLACVTHALSSLCQSIHLKKYQKDGIGSYSLDASSAYFEALCDTIIALILLAVAAGWTLPSDIKPYTDNTALSTTSTAAHLLNTLLNFSRQRGKHGSYQPVLLLFLALLTVHVVLAQWGRMYSEDFDCYHDLEHLPGQILFACRLLMGCLFLYNTAHLRRSSHCAVALRAFYVKFSFIGGMWFIFLSTLAWWTSRLVPVYRRHEVVSGGSAIGQAVALGSLTWLFIGGAGASAFHRVSKVSTAGNNVDGISGDGLGAAGGSKFSCLKIGKVKVRTD